MKEVRVLTAFIDHPNQCEIETYEKNGGYQAIRKVIPHLTPDKLIEQVAEAGLRGRGGAGFPTGKKWSFIPKNQNIASYLVCNADESEPGTFKDRLLMEKDPHQVIEGVILSSYAIKAKTAFIYCRGEYFASNAILRKAVVDAKKQGFLGKNVLGTDYSLEIIIHPGAGAYIAGEETAQLTSLEGYRATPKLKPPFPAIEGLYRKPTIINNVETLCNVVHIVNHGIKWYQKIGLPPKNSGTKIFQLSGHIQNPGCYELPLGTTLRAVLETGGGMMPGRTFKACYPGGSSCAVLTERDLDISMDYETLSQRKSMLGTASIIVMDNTADMVKVAHRLMEFYQDESCGKCTPCREGTRWVVQILERILHGKGTLFDLKTISQICNNMEMNSFCPLAAGAAPSVTSAIKEFESEFAAYINQNAQAGTLPMMKISYPYVT